MAESDDDRWQRRTLPADAHTRVEQATARDPVVQPKGVSDAIRSERFEETGELGRGGMGRVFEAKDHALDRTVAIKQSLTDDTEALARFEREARITAQLQHPGIVPILDIGRDAKGRPFYIMRKIEGRPLASMIGDLAKIADRLALVPRLLGAVEAVAYAHARGVIHRDLKPANVLLGPFGETLVIDWGIARALGDADEPAGAVASPSTGPLTQVGQAFGTPGFMPPEQARGESVDRRADVFALGAMLYHVIAGKLPPIGIARTAEVEALLAEIQHSDEVPPELIAIIGKAMAIDPSARYADANELAEELRRFTTGKLVAAHRYTTRELIARWIGRHRVAVAIGALSLVALAVFATFAVWRIASARDRADTAFHAEAARADELLVERADAIVDSDPAHAIALLKQLRAGSPSWSRAVAVVDSAIARGIAHGRSAHTNVRSMYLVASPDGRTVISAAGDGKVLVHEPDLRAPMRMLAKLDEIFELAWVDASGIAVRTPSGVHRIGLDGSIRPLETGGSITSLYGGNGRLFAMTRERSLHELDLGGGPPRRTIANVRTATRLPKGIAYATAEVAVYEPDVGAPVVLGPASPMTAMSSFAASADGRYLTSIEAGTRVVEWELEGASARQTREWKGAPIAAIYIGQRIFVAEMARQVLVPPLGPTRTIATLSGMLPLATIGDCVVTRSTYELWLMCSAQSFRIGAKTEKFAGVVVAGDRLIAGTAGGTLLSWELERLLPKYVTSKDGSITPHGYGLGSVWTQMTSLEAIDVETQASTDFGDVSLGCIGTDYGLIWSYRGRRLPWPTGEPQRIELVDRNMKRFKIWESAINSTCSADVRQVALTYPDRIDVHSMADPERVLISVPGKPVLAALSGGWLVLKGEDERVTRIEIATGARIAVPLVAPTILAVDATGRVAGGTKAKLALWDGAKVEDIPITGVRGLRTTGNYIVASTSDQSLVILEPDGQVRTLQGRVGVEPTLAIDRPLVTVGDIDGGIAIIDLRDGSRRRIPMIASQNMISPDGSAMLGGIVQHVAIWKLTHASEGELRPMLDELTNATIAPGSTRVGYP
jgi:hypothetical protein